MNSIETAIPSMEKIKKDLKKYENEINLVLKSLDISPINIESPLKKIQAQIDSAKNKFTIAFVGTFKTGKSTVINSLLQLEGEARLSSEFDPDTAKCVRIIKKERRQKYEAEVIFQNNIYPTEHISWNEAKKYTSQVALNNADNYINEKAKKIEEVRYYVDNSFLDTCDILDLPGTGTGNHAEHTDVTDKKIMESDCIFWVVSTDTEPDKESIKNLEKVHHKMLPIINVWQYEQDEISGMMSPEEIKNLLFEQYQAYLTGAEDPVIYYAKEIDMAQQKNEPLKEKWGKISFVNKVTEILQNIHKGDRMTHIKKNLKDALEECDSIFEQIQRTEEWQKMENYQNTNKHEIIALMGKLNKCRERVNDDINNEARKITNEILDIFSSASDAFIANIMDGTNWDAIFHKERFKRELKKDFENNYIKLNDGWLESMTQEFSEHIKLIAIGEYSSFEMELEEKNDLGTFSSENLDVSKFVESMADTISRDISNRIAPIIIATITGGILLLIPGGALIDALGIFASGIKSMNSITDDSKLLNKQNSIKAQSKNEIRQQRSTISRSLRKVGENLNENCYCGLWKEMTSKKKIMEDKFTKLVTFSNNLKQYHSEIEQLCLEINKL